MDLNQTRIFTALKQACNWGQITRAQLEACRIWIRSGDNVPSNDYLLGPKDVLDGAVPGWDDESSEESSSESSAESSSSEASSSSSSSE